MPAAVRDRAIRQAIAVDQRLSGQPTGSLAQAAAALAKAGQPDAAQILSGPVSPGPPGGTDGLAGAFPLPNAAGLLRGTHEKSTTVITFLAFRPGTSFGAQTAGANAYVRWPTGRPRGRGDRSDTGRIRPEPGHREGHPVGRAVHGARHRADGRPAVQVGGSAARHADLRRHRLRARHPGGGVARAADGRHAAPGSGPRARRATARGDHGLHGVLPGRDARQAGGGRAANPGGPAGHGGVRAYHRGGRPHRRGRRGLARGGQDAAAERVRSPGWRLPC